jgi:hypothetical protein
LSLYKQKTEIKKYKGEKVFDPSTLLRAGFLVLSFELKRRVGG